MEKTKNFFKKYIQNIYFIPFFLFLLILSFYLFFGIYFPSSKDQSPKFFLISKGENIYQIAFDLEKEQLIRNRWSFLFYVFFTGNYKKIQAGKYLFSSPLNVLGIVQKFVEGDVFKQKITIPEGWNLEEIAQYLEAQNIAKKDEFLNEACSDFSDQFEFLKDKPKDLCLEGYLFPDSYEIKIGQSSREIIEKMLSNFDKKLTPQIREEIRKQNRTIFEVVVLASLVEKEVKNFDEKRIVAGILLKRLEKKIPLQVDATINYILKKKLIKISQKELNIDSPYNTYKYLGLPKGPISNPSLESILAVLYPQKTDYWYYLATPQVTVFSKNISEHNLAKQKYLR